MMNARTRKLMTLLAIVWSFGLFPLEQSASAQSPNSNCKHVKGKEVDVYPGSGNAAFGTITNGGILNGTTEHVFTSGASATPDPTTVSFTGDFTLTTNDGQLKTSNVYLYDFATGLTAYLQRINSNTSTGRFAGATGMLFGSGKSPDGGITVLAEITGEICFANE
jgi:hypothetical protein